MLSVSDDSRNRDLSRIEGSRMEEFGAQSYTSFDLLHAITLLLPTIVRQTYCNFDLIMRQRKYGHTGERSD